MMTLPDFKEKQTLFVQADWGEKCGIRFRNDNIVFYRDGKIENQLSCHRIFAVFVVGDIFITSKLIKEAQGYGISLFFLKHNFDQYASINAQAEGNYLLRDRQYAMSESRQHEIAKKIVENKIQNQISLLSSIGQDTSRVHELLAGVNSTKSSQELMGVEGNVTRIFFGQYFEHINWYRRMPRAKPDIPNFLMDIGYSYLFNITDSLLRLYGFDTYKGVYHKLFFQRRSLACDIVEPFRSVIDKQIRKSYNLKQIHEKDFSFRNGRYGIDFQKGKKYNRIFAEEIMKHKEDLYLFVQKFYRHVMDEDNEFPTFSIVKR